MDDLRDVFAWNLRRLGHAKRLSQDDLAYEAEVSRSYLSQLEKGGKTGFYASLRSSASLRTFWRSIPPNSRERHRAGCGASRR
jgi:transcriptional regulator with XRE-family HTH domain